MKNTPGNMNRGEGMSVQSKGGGKEDGWCQYVVGGWGEGVSMRGKKTGDGQEER